MNINPYEIFEIDNTDKIGVIVDCKRTETPSTLEDFEFDLARYTRSVLIYRGFKNIIFFREREDFEISLNELTVSGVDRVLYLFAGASVNQEAKSKIDSANHLTAFKINDRVMRKYVVFDTDKYSYYQLKEDFLDNVRDEITSIPMEDMGISYINPDDENYEFLEKIANYELPELSDIKSDVYHAKRLIEDTKEFLLNT